MPPTRIEAGNQQTAEVAGEAGVALTARTDKPHRKLANRLVGLGFSDVNVAGWRIGPVDQ